MRPVRARDRETEWPEQPRALRHPQWRAVLPGRARVCAMTREAEYSTHRTEGGRFLGSEQESVKARPFIGFGG